MALLLAQTSTAQGTAAPILSGKGKWERESWFYSPRTNSPLAHSAGTSNKFVFDLRGDGGQAAGGLAVDANLGSKGPEKCVATGPQIFDLLAGPQGALRNHDEQLHREHLDRTGHRLISQEAESFVGGSPW